MGRDDSEPVMTAARFGIALTTDPGLLRERLATLCAALTPAMGLRVEPVGLWHYHRLLDALEAGDVDFAWLPPLLALRAMGRARVVPLAMPVRSGESAYDTVLFSAPGSRIRTTADLVGVRAAWVDRQSAAGYQIIRAALRSGGVNLESAFAAEQFLGVHDAVVKAVLAGEADVGATFAYLDPTTGAVRRAGWGDAAVQVVSRAGPIPSDVIAASVRVPAPILRRLQRCLVTPPSPELRAAANALFTAEGFVVPDAAHLEPLARLFEQAGRSVPPGPPPATRS